MLSEDEVRSKVRALVMSYLSIHPDKPFEEDAELEKDYQLDLVEVIEVAMDVEEEFGIELDNDDLIEDLTTNKLASLVIKALEGL